jgi:hypothetical protein
LFYIEHVFCDTFSRQKILIENNLRYHEKPQIYKHDFENRDSLANLPL